MVVRLLQYFRLSSILYGETLLTILTFALLGYSPAVRLQFRRKVMSCCSNECGAGRKQLGRLLICISILATRRKYEVACGTLSSPPPSLLPKTSCIPSIIQCPRLLIRLLPPPPPILKPFSMRPWKTTPNKLEHNSANIRSPPRSIAVTAPMPSLMYFKNKPMRLTNSGRVTQNYSSGSDPSSMSCISSLPMKPSETALVT